MSSRNNPADKTPIPSPTLAPQEALRLLKKQQKKAELLLANRPVQRADCNAWENTTREFLRQAFGSTSDNIRTFIHSGQYGTLVRNPSEAWKENRRAESLSHKLVMLHSMIEQLEAQLEVTRMPQKADAERALSKLERICTHFHSIAQQLQRRSNDRPTLTIEHEYDVQDLFHALLRLFFDDIRAEEWTPSYAGKVARRDFLLKPEQTVVEAKKTRTGLTASAVGAQLIEDMARYRQHPACQLLVCFVYDPEGGIVNPRGLEQDLSQQHGDMTVKVFIRP